MSEEVKEESVQPWHPDFKEEGTVHAVVDSNSGRLLSLHSTMRSAGHSVGTLVGNYRIIRIEVED